MPPTDTGAPLWSCFECVPRGREDALAVSGCMPLLTAHVCRCVSHLQSGIQAAARPESKVQLSPDKLRVLLAGPGVSVEDSIDLTPQVVTVRLDRIPQTLTADTVHTAPAQWIQTGFDCMLQTLVRGANLKAPEFPVHPDDEELVLSATQHVAHRPLPIVRAELPNPWIQTPFQRQVLSVLTFYKLWTVRRQGLEDLEEWG